MDETLAAQRTDLAALRALRWEWRTMPDCYARASARPVYRALERALLATISYRARVIARANGTNPWPLSQSWAAAHPYREVIG